MINPIHKNEVIDSIVDAILSGPKELQPDKLFLSTGKNARAVIEELKEPVATYVRHYFLPCTNGVSIERFQEKYIEIMQIAIALKSRKLDTRKGEFDDNTKMFEYIKFIDDNLSMCKIGERLDVAIHKLVSIKDRLDRYRNKTDEISRKIYDTTLETLRTHSWIYYHHKTNTEDIPDNELDRYDKAV